MASYCRKQILEIFSYFLFFQFEFVIQNCLSVCILFLCIAHLTQDIFFLENFECHSFCDALFYNTVANEHIWINIKHFAHVVTTISSKTLN